MTSFEPATGAQYEIAYGQQRAVVVEVGGGLREYTVDKHAILDGYALSQVADGGRGQPLIPWPNRLADGRYTFNGQQHQLPIDEVSRHNASHGLTRWLNWSLLEYDETSVRLVHVIHPRPGYPFTLRLEIGYALDDSGLMVHTRGENLGAEPLPFGVGFHPYLTVGTPLVDAAELQIPARVRLDLDAERRLPTGRIIQTSGTGFDFQKPRQIGSRQLDECFTDLVKGPDGRVRATLRSTDRAVELWGDDHIKYLQVFTGDSLANDRKRRGVAIEPMTCPPDAFRSGTDVIVLAPGSAIDLDWGITPRI